MGTAGFIIDLAVVDPVSPGRYLLGIECDGATYHSSRSARDRDRLRETVLRDRGWKIHRVWSTDWFHRPGEQLQKIVAAIEKARIETEADEGAADEAAEAEPAAVEFNVRDRAIRAGRGGRTRPRSTRGRRRTSRPTLTCRAGRRSTRRAPRVLAEIVARVVEIEGPIHRDEVARRITVLWGLQRTGARIADATSAAIDAAARSGKVRYDADFLSHYGMGAVPVRCRDGVKSAGLRRPEMLPPAEVREAVLRLAAGHIGLGRD